MTHTTTAPSAPTTAAAITDTDGAGAIRTVPAAIAALALGDLPAGVGRVVGQRVEVDLDAVREVMGSEAVGALLRYYRRVLEFRDGAPGAYVDTRRALVRAKLHDPKGGPRTYITEQLAGLRQLPGVALAVEALLARQPDLAEVEDQAGSFRMQLTREDNKTTLRMLVPAVGEWPESVGGPVGPDEVFRQVTVVANHAKSRRSISHRLMAVEVDACERYPDPDQA